MVQGLVNGTFFGLLQNPDPEEASRVVQRLEDPEAVVLASAETADSGSPGQEPSEQNPDPEEASRVGQRLEDPEAVEHASAEEETWENTSVKSCVNAVV